MRKGLLWVCMGAVLWGTAGLSAKWLIDRYHMEALTIGAWRLWLSSPLLLMAATWADKGRKSPLSRESRWWILLFGIAVAGYQAGYFTAVDRTMVSTATLLTVCTAPLLVALVARSFLRERLGERTGVALGVGLVGAALLIGVNSLAGLADLRYLAGNALALAAACCYGGYTLIGKRLLQDVEPFRVIGWSFTVGAVLLLPVLRLPPSDWKAWLALIYLGWVPTALAYILYIRGLQHTTATRASIGALLEPLTATVLAVILLGERLDVAGWIGALLLLSSLGLLSVPGTRDEQDA